MKKLLSIAIAATIGLSMPLFSACGEGGKGPKDTIPEYSEDKTFLIGGWNDPPKTDWSNFDYVKEAGLDFIFYSNYYYGMGTENYLVGLEYLEKIGLKAILQLGSGADMGVANFDRITDYSQYPAVLALNYFDEPSLSTMEALTELADWHIEKYGKSDVNYYVNLFPYTDKIGGSYQEYLDAYCTIMNKVHEATGQDKWLSVDIYPLLSSKYGSTVSTSWLTNLEEVAIAAQKNDVDYFHSFILSTQHGSYRNLDEDDFRYQFWVNMAFGANSISYFTYTTGSNNSWGSGLVDRQGKPVEPNYSGAKKVNEEIHAIDDVYLSFEWEGMYPVTGSLNEDTLDGESQYFYNLKNSLTELEKIKKAEATRDTLIGQFHDEEGRKGYVVTNFADPYFKGEDSADTVTLEFENVNTVLVYQNGEKEMYKVSDGKFTLQLAGGEGVFLIPLNI